MLEDVISRMEDPEKSCLPTYCNYVTNRDHGYHIREAGDGDPKKNEVPTLRDILPNAFQLTDNVFQNRSW